MGRRAIPLLLAGCACSSGFADVALPELDASVRAVLVVREGEGFAIRAYDAATAPSRIPLEDGFGIVTVLHYRRSLEELGIPEGELALASASACASIEIPPADALFAGGRGRRLEPIMLLTESIARLRIAVPCPCVDFEVTAFSLPDSVVRSALPYDERRALLVTNLGFALVDAAANVERIPTPLPFWGSFEDQRGTFWFGSIDGQLWLGDPLGEVRPTFTTSAAVDMVAIGGHVEPERFELLAITKDRWLLRFDGSDWTILYQQPDLTDDQQGALVFLRPGRAVATLPHGNGLLHYDATELVLVKLEEWNPAERGHLIALELIDPHGLFFATRTGRLFLRRAEDEPLEEIPDPTPVQDRIPVHDLVAFRGGFLQVGRQGLVRQWHPRSGFCEPFRLDVQIDLTSVTAIGEVLFAGGSSRPPENNHGYVIRPVQP